MMPQLQPIAQQFAVCDRFLDGLVGDFSDEDWQVTDAVGHDPRWIVGHLAVTRRKLLALVGREPAAEPWEAHFGRGTTPAAVPAGQDPRALVRALHDAHRTLAAAWDQVTPEVLAKPLGRTLPDGSETVGGALGFLAWHESYHLGQLGLLRRLAGKPGRA